MVKINIQDIAQSRMVLPFPLSKISAFLYILSEIEYALEAYMCLNGRRDVIYTSLYVTSICFSSKWAMGLILG